MSSVALDAPKMREIEIQQALSIEPLVGTAMVVISDSNNRRLAGMRLDDRPTLVGDVIHRQAVQEIRSHSFCYG